MQASCRKSQNGRQHAANVTQWRIFDGSGGSEWGGVWNPDGVRGGVGALGVDAAAMELSKFSRTSANRKSEKCGARVKLEYFIPFNQIEEATGQKAD